MQCQKLRTLCSKTNYIKFPYISDLKVKVEAGGNNGPISVIMYGKQGTICKDYWDDAAANVTCKDLGFKGGVALGNKQYSNNAVTWIANLNCTGNETKLSQCKYNEGDLYSCRNTQQVGVLCYQHLRKCQKYIHEK